MLLFGVTEGSAMNSPLTLLALFLWTLAAVAEVPLTRSARSGAWSDSQTWEGGLVPPSGSKVLVRAGHTVIYDRAAETLIRSMHIAGTLRFATDRDTRLDVGLIKVQAGEDVSEEG